MKKYTLTTVMNYDKGNGFAKILSLNNSYNQVALSLVNAWDAIIDVYQEGLHSTHQARHFKYAISWSSLHELKITQLNEDNSNENVDTILAQVPTDNGVDLYVSALYNGNSWIKTRVEVTAFSNQGEWIDGSEFEDISALNPVYTKGSKLNNLSGYHNAIYRGKDLTNKYTIAELESKIQSGDFSDLFIGDYITASTVVNGVTESVDYVIAGFDYMIGVGNLGIGMTNHHAVMITRNTFNTQIKMEDSATTANGYYGSKAHGVATAVSSNAGLTNITVEYDTFQNSILGSESGSYKFTFDGSVWHYSTYTYNPSQLSSVYGISYSGTAQNGDTLTVTYTIGYLEPIRQGIYGVFGKTHCLSYKDLMTTGTTTSAWHTGRVELMNECMVYGTKIHSNGSAEATKSTQLPLFNQRLESKITRATGTNNRTNYWLASISSGSSFCAFGSYGNADYRQANQTNGVRPFFLLG